MGLNKKICEFNSDRTMKFYDWTRNNNKDKHGKVGWSSTKNQIIRFQKLLDVGVMNGETILDFGCGYGDLYDYTLKKGLKIKYIGVDINKSFIYDAVEMHKQYDSCKFYLSDDIRQIKDPFDWFLASGSFTMGFKFKEVLDILKYAYGKSTRGAAFNLLRLRSEYIKTYVSDEGYYLYNPEWVVEQLKKEFPNVEKTDDYLPNDATYYLKK